MVFGGGRSVEGKNSIPKVFTPETIFTAFFSTGFFPPTIFTIITEIFRF